MDLRFDDEVSGRNRGRDDAHLPAGRRMFVPLFGLLGLLSLLVTNSACEDRSGPTPQSSSTTLPKLATSQPAGREPCADRTPTRKALFGDLHVHTGLSMDAYLFDTRTTPADAYRFAKGERLLLAPLDAAGNGTRPVQIHRPLDFAAVTDHAENFGPVSMCTRPESPVYETVSCRTYRGEGFGEQPKTFLETVNYVRKRSEAIDEDEVCGADGRRCRDAVEDFWGETQRAAERHYDRSATCEFTTFVAYEYSFSPELSKVHRNVVFRNEIVLDRPIHAIAEPEPLAMLRRLRDECNDGRPGCEALAIPHNPNLSDGRMFRAEYPGATNWLQQRRAARLRAEMEPLVEMMQVKGDSECRNGLAGVGGPPDELCDFEKMRSIGARAEPPDCLGEVGSRSLLGEGCVDRNDFVRSTLVAGLAEEARIGANPFAFGFIASTDEHDGTMGNVSERSGTATGRVSTNPGGLVGVWAEENARDAIFDALKRRETFATSGPRIQPRFFAGFGLDEGMCARPDLLERAYAGGVPMGGELRAAPGAGSPRFLVTALRDAGTTEEPGNRLERLQVVKGWVGEDGLYEQRVVDVAGASTPDDALSTETCLPPTTGQDVLCGVWTDPEFHPDQAAVYYARVIETPSCRWSTHRCNAASAAERPPFCDAPGIPRIIRERAWTSPIWVRPAS